MARRARQEVTSLDERVRGDYERLAGRGRQQRGIVADTEEHVDFLETQLGLIQAIGEPNYLQKAMGEIAPDDSATGGGL